MDYNYLLDKMWDRNSEKIYQRMKQAHKKGLC